MLNFIDINDHIRKKTPIEYKIDNRSGTAVATPKFTSNTQLINN